MPRRLLPVPVLLAAAIGSAREVRQPADGPKGDTFTFTFDQSKVRVARAM
jgi:hypothetical protein